ncbi:MAG: hypothetical protein ABEI39_05190, partial [Halobacteriales archaeon]
PTPAGPRQAAENVRVDRAQSSEAAGDTAGGGGSVGRTGLATPTPSTPDPVTTPVGDSNVSVPDGSEFGPGAGPGLEREAVVTANFTAAAGEGGGGPALPPRQTVLYGAILIAGVAAIGHRTGVADRLYRALWIRRDPEGAPRERVEAAMARLEYLLGQRYRPRRGDETRREYIGALRRQGLDERAMTLYGLYERAAYAGRVDGEDATTAVRLLRELREDL